MIPYEAAMIDDRPGWLARMLGAQDRDGGSYRMRWGMWSPGWGLSLELINWDEGDDWSLKVQPVYGVAYVRLPFLPDRRVDAEEMLESWGITWDAGVANDMLHLNWGRRTKIVTLPWSWKCVRSEMLCPDGVWRKFKRDYDLLDGDIAAAVETHPYRYVWGDGTVQDVTATIMVSEMEWRPRATPWLPWPRRVHRAIDVTFSAEVGAASTSSWKGGCIGCSYTMKKGETPLETLRRMQLFRRFR